MSERKDRNNLRKLKGKPFDEYRCFFIKDFRKGDSIRVSLSSKKKLLEKGVVTEVDLENCLIHYRTASESDKVTTINKIVTLEGFVKNFLEN